MPGACLRGEGSFLQRLRGRARQLEIETHALFLAYRDPRTPWAARLCAALVVAYALSPIDLVPDFIPLLGLLDDLVLVPAGIALALRLIPPGVMAEARAKAAEGLMVRGGMRRAGALLVVSLWLAGLALVALLLWRVFAGRGAA